MEIKSYQFFSHYVRHPCQLAASREISQGKRAGLLAASVCLWIFTGGIILVFSKILQNRQIARQPQTKNQKMESAASTVFPPSSQTPSPKKGDVSALSLADLKTLGQKSSIEELSQIDLTTLGIDLTTSEEDINKRREKFYALFQIEEGKREDPFAPPSLIIPEKSRQALRNLFSIKVFWMNVDILYDCMPYLFEKGEDDTKEYKQLASEFFSIADCKRIALLGQAEDAFEYLQPSQLEGKEAFKALYEGIIKRDYHDCYNQGLRGLSRAKEILFSPLFSEEHWSIIEKDREIYPIIREFCQEQLSEEEAFHLINGCLNHRSSEKTQKLPGGSHRYDVINFLSLFSRYCDFLPVITFLYKKSQETSKQILLKSLRDHASEEDRKRVFKEIDQERCSNKVPML